MAINVNGYNATFQEFVDFAKLKDTMGGDKAIARVTTGVNIAEGALEGRRITASNTDSVRGLFKWFRSADDKAANNEARKLFKDAIIDMFGGESKIPPAVKKAMILSDYDKGKPLTARRILAVQTAIDASGTKETRTGKLTLETFESPAVEQAARNMGYVRSELPKLARAVHFYAQAQGVSEEDALREVGRPGSEANRLMQYGGRFLENAENFADGLRLIEKFSAWHDGISAVEKNLFGKDASYEGLDTPTKVNVNVNAVKSNAKPGLERFIFEDIASNPDFNLKEADAERAFGVEHNPVSRQLVVSDNTSSLGTIANVPPAKRRTVYAAFNAINTLAETGPGRADRKSISLESLFLARILRNLPKLESILSKTGTLTARDIIKTCYPDIRDPGNYDVDTIAKWEVDLNDTLDRMQEEGEIDRSDRAAITSMMESSGATLKEAQNAYESGKKIPPNQYFSTLQFSILEAAPTADSGINTMKGDIERISTYTDMTDDGNMFSAEKHRWNFTFPDGERLKTGGASKNDIQRVEEKIRNLCGEVHQKQIGAVAYLLSQSGTGVLRDRPLAKYGINSNEHSPVNFALSRNAETGAVTITYTSPKELPVKFSWTATVGVDGTVTSTPFTIEKPVARLDERAARTLVDGAIAKLGVGLDEARRNEAVQLLQKHGTNMYRQNAQLFAKFIVNLVNHDATPQARTALAAATAASLREWRDFGFGDKGMAAFANAAKDMANAVIRDYMKPGNADKFNDNILGTMTADANRATFILNGTTYRKTPAAQLIPAFKSLVPDPKKQKALSSWLNQLCASTFKMPSMGVQYNETGVNAIKLPGAGALANIDMTSGIYMNDLLDSYGHDLVHDLQVSPDGKTATITQTVTADLSSPGSQMYKKISFGQVTISQRLVIDLTAEIPTVTDFQVSQEFDW